MEGRSVAGISRLQAAGFAVALAVNVILTSASAPAAIDVAVATRITVTNQPMGDCSMRAKNALTTVMQNATEAGAGSGHWFGVGRINSQTPVSASAVVECHADAGGYSASITCAAEVPPNPDTAATLCQKLTTAFGTPASVGVTK